MSKTAIIIPCYNEALRLNTEQINSLAQNKNVTIFFANDGSKDGTVDLIIPLTENTKNCFLLDYKKNEGKANTVYKAVNHIYDLNQYDYIGYFDADFSTPAAEILRLISEIETSDADFVIGSRVLLLNSNIKRKTYRHIIGRMILTIVNFKYKLGIYDTQCGAKLFDKKLIQHSFNRPFHTSWLFDVEVFVRLQKKGLLGKGKEVPIYNWRDVDGSKLGMSSSIKIFKELITLYQKYD